MPTYDFRCTDCGNEFALLLSMKDDRPTHCEHCEGELQRVIQPAMIAPDIAPYQSIVTGETITGRKAHREHLQQHGMQEVGDQMSKRQRNYIENDPFEQRLKWYRDKGEKPPENLRQIVEAENG